ncbi:MAG: hypothetical protein QOH42_2356 [Blastocatellia bacterium]|nr:hypothetical protein [Blastocatellia bacterium]
MERGHPVRQRAQHAHYFPTEGPFALCAQADRMSAIRNLEVVRRCSREIYSRVQHAENENIRLQNLWDGIETLATVMTMKPKSERGICVPPVYHGIVARATSFEENPV